MLTLARRVGSTGRVIGLDLTQAMLDVARARAVEQGLAQADFLRCPLEQLALPDATADWVLSNCALNHAADQAAVWREIARILKPGGRFVVSDIYAVEPIEERWRTDPTAVAECWAGARTRAEVLGHVADAGLTEVQVLEERAPYQKAAATLASFTLAGRRSPALPSRAEPTPRR